VLGGRGDEPQADWPPAVEPDPGTCDLASQRTAINHVACPRWARWRQTPALSLAIHAPGSTTARILFVYYELRRRTLELTLPGVWLLDHVSRFGCGS